jgi:membrane protease YdiL (CAAX protease family)
VGVELFAAYDYCEPLQLNEFIFSEGIRILKKHLVTTGKAFCFFILWAVSLTVMVIPAVEKPAFFNENAASLRLWWELVPLLGIFLVTGIFIWVVEKNKIKIPILKNPIKNIIMGFAFGCVWLGGVILFLFSTGLFVFGERNSVEYLPVWFIAVLLNVIMQNYLVRGYLFSLFKEKYNTAAGGNYYYCIVYGNARRSF